MVMLLRITIRHQLFQSVLYGYCCLFLSQGQVMGQSFGEALRGGQTIQVTWIHQERQAYGSSTAHPVGPDELKPGEEDIRIGLRLTLEKEEGQVVAEITYVSYLGLPELQESAPQAEKAAIFPPPTILDSRFQDAYFDPQLFLFSELVGRNLPTTCQPGPYQQFLDQFYQDVRKAGVAADLLESQLARLEQVSLPFPLAADALAKFLCEILNAPVPAGESPVQMQANKRDNTLHVDYLEVDHPVRVCRLVGTIERPATAEVRVKYFQEGNWLEYWQDTVLQLDDQGHFQFAFPLDHAQELSFSHGQGRMFFYFEPGDTVEFITNANAFYREMNISGNARAENNFLLDFYRQMRGDTLYQSWDFDLLEKEYDTTFQSMRTKERRELAFLAARAAALRPGFIYYMDRFLKLQHANTQWEAAYRYLQGKRIFPDTDLLNQLQQKASLLYRLPRAKGFGFNVEEYLAFQFYLIQNRCQGPDFGKKEDWVMGQLLPSKETFVRHATMQLFREYTDAGKLSASGRAQLAYLLSISKDEQLQQEMRVFAQANHALPDDVGFPTLRKGIAAPPWRFASPEGIELDVTNFAGQKLLLHIGRADNLDVALTDVQLFAAAQAQLPEIVHLLTADSKSQFAKYVEGKAGVFLFVPPAAAAELKQRYSVNDQSNQYFLIGEDGKVLANQYDLGTVNKIRGTWAKLAAPPAVTSWTPAQRLRFWQSLGVGAIIILLITALVLWRRRIISRRERRQRQLLEVELRGIRSQMNPHFLFNAMSSIQYLIRKNEQEKADEYLGEFAGLMRKTLRNSAEEFIPLADEVEALAQYCSLESLRQPFHYAFQIDDRIDAHNTYIPSMILQPIIENAIIHGLAPRTGARELLVRIGPGQEGLSCTVTDNGIGLLAAQERGRTNDHQSMGMKLVRQRLALMGLSRQEHVTLTDRNTLTPAAQGTVVSITIPLER